jgi:uncharacterized protein YndB with AHSA1/START domain
MERPTAEAAIDIAAPPERVYELVSDVVRVPEWALEVDRCSWLGDATGPVVGARFRGSNKHTWRRWRTTSTITAADPPTQFAFRVKSGVVTTADWEYLIEPIDGGCRITELTERKAPDLLVKVVSRFGLGIRDRDEHNQRNIEASLARLKEHAERH